MKASDFIALYLEARGVTHVFELVGGMITHLLDSIDKKTNVKLVSCHHEQAAAFAAEGHARITGVPGVALATSGPGATNLLTAVGSCYFDSTPAVFITGQVNTYELKGERGIRQLGFQETDIVSIAAPICKSAVQVQKATDLIHVLESAFCQALEGRPGPCLIDIPMNIQAEEIDEALVNQCLHLTRSGDDDTTIIKKKANNNKNLTKEFTALLEAIERANSPLLLMGGGCAAALNRNQARLIAERLGIPVVLSLMAVDLLPESHPQRVGFIGSYGNRWANKALGTSDLLIVIGSRLDIRQTGSNVQSFCEGKQIWQIDLDRAEMGVRIEPHRTICCSIETTAHELLKLPDLKGVSPQAWLERINSLRVAFPASSEYPAEKDEINPVQLLQKLSALTTEPCHYVTDVGQHQMWAAQSIQFRRDDRFLTSGGMGAMGFGLPAAIGSAFSHKDALTILISGDGSFQLNVQELETLKRNNLNLKIILFNNQCHGMVRQFQESYFKGNLRSTVDGYSAPDFVAISNAYGISARRLNYYGDMDDDLDWLILTKGSALLEVPLSVRSKVYPKLAFGRKFGEMEPESSPIAMEST
jgi:acetolactate synthase-1/2/3 large subunit